RSVPRRVAFRLAAPARLLRGGLPDAAARARRRSHGGRASPRHLAPPVAAPLLRSGPRRAVARRELSARRAALAAEDRGGGRVRSPLRLQRRARADVPPAPRGAGRLALLERVHRRALGSPPEGLRR